MTDIDKIIDRLSQAQLKLKEVAQGRVYSVGNSVLLGGKYGVVVDLNKDSTDPAGSTVDIRLEDGTIKTVNVTSESLQRYRA